MLRLNEGTNGQAVVVILSSEDGSTPLDLTSATVVAYQYEIGNNSLITSNSCTITSATLGAITYDLTTANTSVSGMYYVVLDINYISGVRYFRVGESLEIFEDQETIVTVPDFLKFMNIAPENAPSDDTMLTYLETSEALVNLQVGELENITDPRYIKIKTNLIKIKAAVLYYMNIDENIIDPNKRLPKIEFWTEQYNIAIAQYGQLSSSDPESGAGLVRRVKHS